MWFFTVAQKCHGKFNLLTANSICSRQIQFAHGNFNLLRANSICSRQFQYFNLFAASHGHSLNRGDWGRGCVLKMVEDERMLFESLFYEGYEYKEIVQILRTQHDIELNLGTLKRKLKDYNLSRNNVEFDPNELREIVV